MSTGPRLVYDADAPGSRDPAPPADSSRARRPWLAILLAAALGLAGWQAWRAAGLATQVESLTAELATAHAEIAARSRHLDAIRASLDDVRQRVDGLSALAAQDPTGPAIAPSAPVPAP